MAKSTNYAGYCKVCRAPLRAGEGAVENDPADRRGYKILCPEHMREGSLDPPKPPEASKMRSIHLDDDSHRAVRWWAD